jgi:hypothetical protein
MLLHQLLNLMQFLGAQIVVGIQGNKRLWPKLRCAIGCRDMCMTPWFFASIEKETIWAAGKKRWRHESYPSDSQRLIFWPI